MLGLPVLMALLLGCSASEKPVAPARVGEARELFIFNEAPLPKGYPRPGPIGVVMVKDYPMARAAMVRADDLGGADSNRMFMPLFNHIKKNDIAMTSPVVMGYSQSGDVVAPNSMAFVYANVELGQIGMDGEVNVEDFPAMTFVSVGVRGSYNESNFRKGLESLHAWLAANAQYEASGPPRYLGYNSPFVPGFLRYGEVQIPVRSKSSACPRKAATSSADLGGNDSGGGRLASQLQSRVRGQVGEGQMHG